MFLDSDDQLLPDAVKRYSSKTVDNDLIVAAVIKVSADLLRWRTVTPDRDRVRKTGFTPILAGGFAIRSSLFHQCGGYDEKLRYSENTELGWRLRAGLRRDGRIDVVEEPAAVVFNQIERAHDQSRYDAALRILDRRSYEMESEPANARARRHVRANYLAIAGVSAARIGRRREAFALVLARAPDRSPHAREVPRPTERRASRADVPAEPNPAGDNCRSAAQLARRRYHTGRRARGDRDP